MKKIKEIIAKRWQDFIAILLMSISVVFILLDIVEIFSIPSFYMPYIVLLPITITVMLNLFWIQKKNPEIISNIYHTVGMTIIEYLGLVLFDKMIFPAKLKIIIYMMAVSYMLIYCRKKSNADVTEDKGKRQENDKKIFSLYYINTEKVYEIAMLLNNKIITGGIKEKELEAGIDEQTNIGISSNLNYLEIVKGELGMSQNVQTHNSIKNKVLENFDVKTTKSNMLANIITKANVYKEDEKINVGDLILIKNASLKLLNEEDSYAVTKMILNGAFKDTKISNNSDDMKIELDLSAMINSVLKDCAYELGCVAGNKKFLLTIPMTFENDFENSYNIYDLQVGSVTVVGIYRGKRQYEKRLSLQEIFSENNDKKKHTYEDGELQLQSSVQREKAEIESENNRDIKNEEYREVIDVIAVIQEINVEKK